MVLVDIFSEKSLNGIPHLPSLFFFFSTFGPLGYLVWYDCVPSGRPTVQSCSAQSTPNGLARFDLGPIRHELSRSLTGVG